MRVCHGLKSLLNLTQWPDIVFYEDRVAPDDNPDREENVVARATVAEFNKIRKSVLTTSLLDDGISEGSLYAAQSFAQRFLDSGKSSRPLSIAVTGNSFTIGSNCGENASHKSDECAWPNRLAQRWKEIVSKAFGNTTNSEIEWTMLQENAQASNNVMYRLPSLFDEYHSNNKTLDVLIMNNGITYGPDSDAKWFEAVVRTVLQYFPKALIIALVDGIPEFVGNGDNYAQKFLQSYTIVQDHYNLTRIDFARMSRLLRDSDEKKYSILRQQYRNSSMLWPQVNNLMYANGTLLEVEFAGVRRNGQPLYWPNYTPRVQKTKDAYYPNHPPWTTHQFVSTLHYTHYYVYSRLV